MEEEWKVIKIWYIASKDRRLEAHLQPTYVNDTEKTDTKNASKYELSK